MHKNIHLQSKMCAYFSIFLSWLYILPCSWGFWVWVINCWQFWWGMCSNFCFLWEMIWLSDGYYVNLSVLGTHLNLQNKSHMKSSECLCLLGISLYLLLLFMYLLAIRNSTFYKLMWWLYTVHYNTLYYHDMVGYSSSDVTSHALQV